MSGDPFGNLQEWGTVLELLDELASTERLAECQRGLVRILNYKGNWRLREEVLKRLDQIQQPADELVGQVLSILADDNVYYEARILAGRALTQLLKNGQNVARENLQPQVRKTIEKLCNTLQPPFFEEALKSCNQALA